MKDAETVSADLLALEGIVKRDAKVSKVGDIPGCYTQLLRLCNREDQQVSLLDGLPTATRFRLQDGATESRLTIERQYLTVGSQKLGKPILKEFALLPRRKSLDPGRKLIDPYRGQRDG
jgi:hypothetical protein